MRSSQPHFVSDSLLNAASRFPIGISPVRVSTNDYCDANRRLQTHYKILTAQGHISDTPSRRLVAFTAVVTNGMELFAQSRPNIGYKG